MIKYNIADYVMPMDIVKTNSERNKSERNRYKDDKHALKECIYKWLYYDGYFDGCGFSEEDMKFFKNGFSPIRINAKGNEVTLFTVHHIKPLICGGETRPSNLLPLPRSFHTFIHEKIVNPQLDFLEEGDEATIVAMPDFSKITLPMAMDVGFRIQYHKFLVDKYRLIPHHLIDPKTCELKERAYREWYNNQFKNIH